MSTFIHTSANRPVTHPLQRKLAGILLVVIFGTGLVACGSDDTAKAAASNGTVTTPSDNNTGGGGNGGNGNMGKETDTTTPNPPIEKVNLRVNVTGSGIGDVVSTPERLFCAQPGFSSPPPPDNFNDKFCTGDFEKNTVVTLRAEPSGPDQRFSGWTEDCASAGTALTCEVTMSSPRQVTARFVNTTPRVQIDVRRIGSAAATGQVMSNDGRLQCPGDACSVTTTQGDRITLMAKPAAGSVFTGWYDAPECNNAFAGQSGAPYPTTCTIEANRARTVAASFSATPAVAQADSLTADRCDPTVPQHCLYPFPNNHFTTTASKGVTNDTGIRVNLNLLSMPRNVGNVPINPTEWNRQDGFSPGPKLVTYVAGLDYDALKTMKAPLIDSMARSQQTDSPVVLIDSVTGYRVPVYIEPERSRFVTEHGTVSDADRAMAIRVAHNLLPGRRYIAVIRDVKAASGTRLEAHPNFRVYRDGVPTGNATLEARRPALEKIFTDLKRFGIERFDVYQAWDFTVASEKNLQGRVLAMRDQAMNLLGDRAPQVAFNAGRDLASPDSFVTSPDPAGVLGQSSGGVEEDRSADPYRPYRVVTGHVVVPCFLNTPNCVTGSAMFYQPSASDPLFGDGIPRVNPTPNLELQTTSASMRATFTCTIPKSIFNTKEDGTPDVDAGVKYPARVSLYGHGLLGARGEVNASHVQQFSREYNLMMCAMNWTGFSTEDVPTAVAALLDMNSFPRFIDRQLQGMVNWLMLQEALARPAVNGGMQGLAPFRVAGKAVYGLDEERDAMGRPIAGKGGIFYDGNSQGGIMGGALMAISPRICHGVLGVPGMNYSTLLRRSSDYQATPGGIGYSAANDNSYRNPLDQAFIYSLIQMLWDRGESNGYMHNLSNGLGNTAEERALTTGPLRAATNEMQRQCEKKVLLHVGFGDHQVSIYAAEAMALTARMKRIGNMLPAGRHPLKDGAFLGIPAIPDNLSTFSGSALVEFDSTAVEVDPPPLENFPPRTKDDPHEHPRRAKEARVQKGEFLRSNGFIRSSCTQSSGFCDASAPQRRPLAASTRNFSQSELGQNDARLRSDASIPAVR